MAAKLESYSDLSTPELDTIFWAIKGAVRSVREGRMEGLMRTSAPPYGEIIQSAVDLLVSQNTVTTSDVAQSVNKDPSTGRALPHILAAAGFLGAERRESAGRPGRPVHIRDIHQENVASFTEALCDFRERIVARMLGYEPEYVQGCAVSLGENEHVQQHESQNAALYLRFIGLSAYTILATARQGENPNAKGLPQRVQAAIDQHIDNLQRPA